MIQAPERIAAIDVGSNTILLTVAEYHPGSALVVVDEAEDQPRLGAGLAATGRLSEESIERALRSLTRMRDLCARHAAKRVAAVATAAVREAENGEEFVDRVRSLGIPLRTIAAETEAALSYRSAAHHFPNAGRVLVADIGGGSLELIGAISGRIILILSLPLGSVRLSELKLPVNALRHHIAGGLARAVPIREWSASVIIGSGGTFVTLGSIALARRGSPDSVHGVEIAAGEVEQLLAWLNGLSPEERRQVPGLRPERADIIVAGLAVAAELLERVEASGVRVSGFGLRDGLLLEMVHSP